MSHDHSAKHPVPVEVEHFRLLTSTAAPTHAVVEFRTKADEVVRLFLSKSQLQRLAAEATIAVQELPE